jgi:hypothetical protein
MLDESAYRHVKAMATSNNPRADQPYFSMADQPKGRGIKGDTRAVGERVNIFYVQEREREKERERETSVGHNRQYLPTWRSCSVCSRRTGWDCKDQTVTTCLLFRTGFTILNLISQGF